MTSIFSFCRWICHSSILSEGFLFASKSSALSSVGVPDASAVVSASVLLCSRPFAWSSAARRCQSKTTASLSTVLSPLACRHRFLLLLYASLDLMPILLCSSLLSSPLSSPLRSACFLPLSVSSLFSRKLPSLLANISAHTCPFTSAFEALRSFCHAFASRCVAISFSSSALWMSR